MALPQTTETTAAVAPSVVTAPASPSLDLRGGAPLPKPLNTYAPFRDLLTALRDLSATPSPAAAAAAELPVSVPLGTTTETAVAVVLGAPAAAERPTTDHRATDRPATTPGTLLRETLEMLAHTAGLRRARSDAITGNVGPWSAGSPGAARPEGAPSGTTTRQAGRPALAAFSLHELAAAVEAEMAFQSFLHDGLILASDTRALGAAADLARRLRSGSEPDPLALAGAAARGSDGGAAEQAAHLTRPDQQTDRFLRATEVLLLRFLAKGAGTTAFAMTLAQVYLSFAAPFIRLAASQQVGAGTLPDEATPARPSGAAGHSEDVAAVLRALLARDAITASNRDLALLSADLGHLLAHHRRGLQRLREARGFLAAVRATASSAQRRQPLGVLLEAGRPAATGMAASGRAVLLRALTTAGSEGGALLDGLARAAAEGGERSLAAVLAAPDSGKEDRQGPALTPENQATVARMTGETRMAARRLHGVLLRELAAAERLSEQLEGLQEGQHTGRRALPR